MKPGTLLKLELIIDPHADVVPEVYLVDEYASVAVCIVLRYVCRCKHKRNLKVRGFGSSDYRHGQVICMKLGTQGKMLTTVLTVQYPSGTHKADEFYVLR
jgi:hypothetical protein